MPAFYYFLAVTRNGYNSPMQNECTTCERLLLHLNDRCFVTGTELGRELGISRAAVHKHIESLKAHGLPVEGISGRGYRLARGVDLMDEVTIWELLDKRYRHLVNRIIVERSVDSTNSHLLRLAVSGPIHGVVCITEAQPSGRGGRGRGWVATPYRNLLMSIGWVYDSWPRDITALSVAVGISLIEAMRELDINGIGMKWPNDLLIEGKKLGGILIEISGESSGQCSIVIGIGINAHIGQAEGSCIDQPWTDLSSLLGRDVDRNALAAACISALCHLLRDFPERGFDPWRRKWSDVDVLTGKEVSISSHQRGKAIDGMVTGLDSTGSLLVAVTGGGVRSFMSGEVSVRTR